MHFNMFAQGQQPQLLTLLYQQHGFYTGELARTHEVLSKLYKKLSKTERRLAEWKEQELSRADKKRLQWSRSLTKSTVTKLEAQQASIYDLLHQCTNLISSYDARAYRTAPQTPGTAHLPPSPYPFSPFSPFPPTPWTAGPYRPCFGEQQTQMPQYWDLSMLRERRISSPAAGSADSGFYEPAVYGGLPSGIGETDDPNHVYSHELMSSSSDSAAAGGSTASNKSSVSEQDDVPDLLAPVSPTKVTAEKPDRLHRRRYSENALHQAEGRRERFGTHQRGKSVEPRSRMARTVTEPLTVLGTEMASREG